MIREPIANGYRACIARLMRTVNMPEVAEQVLFGEMPTIEDLAQMATLAFSKLSNVEAELTAAHAKMDSANETWRTTDAREDMAKPQFADLLHVVFPDGIHLTAREDVVRFLALQQVLIWVVRYTRDFEAPNSCVLWNIHPHIETLEDVAR